MKKIILIIALSIIIIMLAGLIFVMVKKDSSKELIYKELNVTEKDIDVVKSEIELEGSELIYEMEFYYQNVKYEFTVDMINNVIISIDKDENKNTNQIDQEKAKEIALNKAGISKESVNNIVVEEEMENGALEYEVKFVYEQFEYECTVDSSGVVINFEKEPLNS